MTSLGWNGLGTLVGILGVAYAVVAGGAWSIQRTLLFPAPREAVEPHAPGATLVRLPMPGGGVAVALHFPAPAGAPTVVHFHGNGEQLADVAALGYTLRNAGVGVYAVEYPGYGLAAATPASEATMLAAAEAALAHLHGPLGVPPSRVVLEGQSLGTGVAAQMALRGHGARLVLLSPYSSVVDMARRMVPFLPVGWLVRDRFDTAAIAPRIELPVLIVHGTDDEVIPVAMGRRLATLFPHATLLIRPGRHHMDLFNGGDLVDRIAAFARGDPD